MKRAVSATLADPSGRVIRRKATRGTRLAAAAEARSGNPARTFSQIQISTTTTSSRSSSGSNKRCTSKGCPPNDGPPNVVDRSPRVPRAARASSARATSDSSSNAERSADEGSVFREGPDLSATAKTGANGRPELRTTSTKAASGRSRENTAGSDAAMLTTLMSQAIPMTKNSEEVAQQAETQPSGAESEAGHRPSSLETMFMALEQVLVLFRRRNQTTVLRQVRPAVEGMCERSFTKQHLARIMFVYPGAYKLSSKTDLHPTRGGYHLRDILIESGTFVQDGAPQNPAVAHTLRAPDASEQEGGRVREGVVATSGRRREAFRQLLCSAKARYCKCDTDTKDAKDALECPCLPEALLPDTTPMPVAKRRDSCRAVKQDPSAPVEAVGTRASCTESNFAGESELDRYGREEGETVKDVDALRRILRRKDAISAAQRDKSEAEKEGERWRKAHLPALADAIRYFFARAQRSTCSMDALVDAVAGLQRHTMSGKEARDRIGMLADVVPEWCCIVAPPLPPPKISISGSGNVFAIDHGMVALPAKTKEVVRINTRLQYREVRQMIVFMAGGAGPGR